MTTFSTLLFQSVFYVWFVLLLNKICFFMAKQIDHMLENMQTFRNREEWQKAVIKVFLILVCRHHMLLVWDEKHKVLIGSDLPSHFNIIGKILEVCILNESYLWPVTRFCSLYLCFSLTFSRFSWKFRLCHLRTETRQFNFSSLGVRLSVKKIQGKFKIHLTLLRKPHH